MTQPIVHSNNPSIQRVLDQVSLFRRKLIPDGTPAYWVYDRLIKNVIMELLRGSPERAWSLLKFRLGMFVDQRFVVDPYLDWMVTNEPLPYEQKKQASEIARFPYKPLVSIVTPVYHPPANVLTHMLDSVASQSYPNWEHCLVNADPSDLETSKWLAAYAKKDPRFRVQSLETNQGISLNTNAAIQMAQGEWIAFLDHDDQLAPFALYEVVKRINQSPEIDVLYSDEDKINLDNQQRFSPVFKPQLNLDYLRCTNYIAHLLVVRKSLGDELGWEDPAFDGSQDHDLTLRLVERTCHVAHIPKILYHWKAVMGSTSVNQLNKTYAVEAGERAVAAHLKRSDPAAHVEPGKFPYQVRYPINGQPKISIIIPNRNNTIVLKRLIDSIFINSTYPNYEIVIVENGSREPETFTYYDAIKGRPNVTIVTWKEAFNYSLVNNFGVSYSTGEIILLLNNDIQVLTPDWMERMLEHALRPDIGAVGAKLLYPNNTIQHAGVIVGMFGVAGHSHKLYPYDSPGYYNRLICAHNYSALTAACLMLRRDVFDEVNGLDPAFQIEFGDIDFCLRILQRGYRNLWTPYAVLVHYESITRGGYDTKAKRELNRYEADLFRQRWAGFLKQGDPAYNPNLSIKAEDFSFNL